jgi:hypothetical protein
MSNKLNLSSLLPIIEEAFNRNTTFKIPITGTSMNPLLFEKRDFVFIKKPEFPLEIGDIPLYRRDSGYFVLHRIVGKDEKGYILCGDNQVKKEYGITEKHIIAVVKSITRKGKTFSVNKFLYKLYVKLWTLILPFRNIILVPLRKIKGLLK